MITLDRKQVNEETPEQMSAKMNILDYLIMANDPTIKAIYTINELVRKHNIVKWLKETNWQYYWTDQQMLEMSKEF